MSRLSLVGLIALVLAGGAVLMGQSAPVPGRVVASEVVIGGVDGGASIRLFIEGGEPRIELRRGKGLVVLRVGAGDMPSVRIENLPGHVGMDIRPADRKNVSNWAVIGVGASGCSGAMTADPRGNVLASFSTRDAYVHVGIEKGAACLRMKSGGADEMAFRPGSPLPK